MQTVLIAGAGKSSIYLIQYLLHYAEANNWQVIVADGNADAIREKIRNHPRADAVVMDITSKTDREPLVKRADLVISLMPAHLHIHLAKDCLQHGKHLITSSYISDEMKEMDGAVRVAGLMFLCEMGLDPGIDHMSAHKIFKHIQGSGGVITSFKSYCGGLVAPESDDNLWHYKFSWNPRNVVVAGYGGARYLENGNIVELPYQEMFAGNRLLEVAGAGTFAYYPNRDSLKYPGIYGLDHISTFMRATLRHPAYCRGWQALVQMGLTRENDRLPGEGLTYAGWIAGKAEFAGDMQNLELFVATSLGMKWEDEVMDMMRWLGLFEPVPVKEGYASSADVLLGLLLDKWEMKPTDKDWVVMQHEVGYEVNGSTKTIISSMELKGKDREFSAMAKCVGLPIAIWAKLVLSGKVKLPAGVLMPVMPQVFEPVLAELVQHGICFEETDR